MQLLYLCYVDKSQNFVIFVVLTVFGICGVGILVLLRPVKNEGAEKSDVSQQSFSFVYHFSSVPIQSKESEFLLRKMSPPRTTK